MSGCVNNAISLAEGGIDGIGISPDFAEESIQFIPLKTAKRINQ
jgi:hypothetical protein